MAIDASDPEALLTSEMQPLSSQPLLGDAALRRLGDVTPRPGWDPTPTDAPHTGAGRRGGVTVRHLR